jgi:hypothetical protein
VTSRVARTKLGLAEHQMLRTRLVALEGRQAWDAQCSSALRLALLPSFSASWTQPRRAPLSLPLPLSNNRSHHMSRGCIFEHTLHPDDHDRLRT